MALTGTDAFGVVNLPVSLGGTSFKKDVLEKSEGERVDLLRGNEDENDVR